MGLKVLAGLPGPAGFHRWVERIRGRTSGAARLGLAAGLAALAVGCTGSDPLTSGSGNFETTLELDNISGRFTDNDFDAALLQFRQIEVRPTDPVADANTGTLNLGLLRDPFRANFVSGIPSSVRIGLTSGEYKLQRIRISAITLNDIDPLTVAGLSDPVNPTCHDFIKNFNINSIPNGIDIFADDLTEDVVRRLDANDDGQLRIRVDYQGFLDALAASIDCSSCNCPALYMPNMIPRRCSVNGAACSVNADCPTGQTCNDCTCPVSATSSFSVQTFIAETSNYLSFE
jgi:hypothetical protein